ncbi:hypothetical protein MFUR16E_04490 [Methylobacterium fujisawaense]|uniref:hypothetical protein n=1 Tax=Methylobacterium fujisawaense TaxID=107400 RepID=UPI002F2CCA89
MMLIHTPRPAAYGPDIVALTLALSTVDLAEAEACRHFMLEAFGVVPNVDWDLVRAMALIIRRSHDGEIA